MTVDVDRHYNWHRYYEARVVSRGGRRFLAVAKKSGHASIDWNLLQVIKGELLGADSYCVEVYPPRSFRKNHVRWLLELPREIAELMPTETTT